MLFSIFHGRIRSVHERLFYSIVAGLFLLLYINYVIIFKKHGSASNSIRTFSDEEEKTLGKLNLLRDDDPLLSTSSRSDCTLGLKKILSSIIAVDGLPLIFVFS